MTSALASPDYIARSRRTGLHRETLSQQKEKGSKKEANLLGASSHGPKPSPTACPPGRARGSLETTVSARDESY